MYLMTTYYSFCLKTMLVMGVYCAGHHILLKLMYCLSYVFSLVN